MNQFYSYVYLDPRKPGSYEYSGCKFPYEPFYVGKGCKDRFYPSTKLSENNGNKYLKNKMKKIGLNSIIIEFLKKNITNEEACELEKEIISLVGRWDLNNGPLLNMADGGDGSVNIVVSEEVRRKMSQSKKGITTRPAGWHHTLEAREKIREASTRRLHTEVSRDKMSQIQKSIAKYGVENMHYGKKRSDKTKLKMRNAQLGKKHSKEAREKMRQAKLKDPTRYWQGKSGPNKGIKLSERIEKRIETFKNKQKNRKE